jgi:L-cysteine:1D-myo-inositol 2-amino-2-deoxy-alpha-D-glucopyranoside ligase
MGVYVCGITPYDSAHLGHAFTYAHFDVLVRWVRHLGADVTHVQNITDVDDDMLRTARERGVDYQDLARREVAKFEAAMATIRITPPTHMPKATEYIEPMLEEVQALFDAGHAYERNGTVYFRVSSDPDYGKLSRLGRDEMLDLAAERGGHPEDPNKDDPLDFVLWQRSAGGEPWWDSPWGPGRPGWHIECSTMARRLLGQPIDIHGGGTDLIFPHHESEIAQAECVPGREQPFVRHWVHTGTVHLDGDKMSKSLGNMAFVDDLVERYPAVALREFLLRRHYREDWVFSEPELAEFVEKGPPDPGEGPTGLDAFERAVQQDLDTPGALRILDRAALSGDTKTADQGRTLLGLEP